MEKVIVLMSTYNGEKYIKQQVDSILNQENVSVELVVRDDGSNDNTISILKEYEKAGKLIWYTGDNKGPAYSFFDLMEYAKNRYDDYCYFALSDQDDIWKKQKLYRAITELKENDSQLYYCSKQLLSDNKEVNGRIVKIFPMDKEEHIIRNCAGGCTMVMSYYMLGLVCMYRPKWVEMHDSWIARVAYFNDINFVEDEEAMIMYRIHNDNVCGTYTNLYEKIRNKLKYDIKQKNVIKRTASELLQGYNQNLSCDNKEILNLIANYDCNFYSKINLLKKYRKCKFTTKQRKVDFVLKVIWGRI